jgi:hypothetical protein
MSVENIVDVVVVLVKITFLSGIIALILKVVSEILKTKDKK